MEQVLSLVLKMTGADGIIGETAKLTSVTDTAAVAADRESASLTLLAKNADQAAAATARYNLEAAKQSTGVGSKETAAATTASAAANDKAKLSTLANSAAQKDLANSTALASAEAKTAETSAGGLGGILQSLTGQSAGAAGSLAGLASAAAPLVIFAVLAKMVEGGVEQFVSLTAQVRRTQAVLGGSAKAASAFVGEMRGLGIDVDAASKAFFKFGSTIGEGKSKLDEYNIAIAHNKDGSTDLMGTLENLRTAYQGTTDAAERDAIAAQVSLRGGIALLPVLSASDATLKQIAQDTKNRGEIFSQNDLNNGRNLKIAMTELSNEFKGLEEELAKGVIPAIIGTTKGLTDMLAIVGKLNSLTNNKLFGYISDAENPVKGLVGSFESLFGVTTKNTKAIAAHQAAIDADDKAMAQLKTDTDSLVSASQGLVSAQRSQATALKDLQTATEDYAKADDAQRKLVADGVAGFDEYQTAMDGYTSAVQSATDAGTTLTQAVLDLDKAQQPATALELADANNKLADSLDSVSLAADDVNDKQTKLNELLAYSSGATADDVKRARDELQAAKDKTADANVAVGQAQLNRATVGAIGSDTDPAVIAAKAQVVTASKGVTTAMQAEGKAYAAVQKSQEDYAQAVKDGQAALDTSLSDIHDKVNAVEDANLAASKAQDAMTDALHGVDGAVTGAEAYLKDFPSYYDALNTAATNAGLAVDAVNSSLTAPGATPAAPTFTPTANGGPPSYSKPSIAGGRAGGGPVDANSTYLVGENGPELLHMGASAGMVSPHGAGTGSLVGNLTIVAQSGASAADIAREVPWALNTVIPAARTKAA